MEEGLLIGRTQQKKIFEEALASKKSEFIVVYGRRRVGKTYLIKQVLGQEYFKISSKELLERYPEGRKQLKKQ